MKERNKFYSKASRRKHKEYVKELENKIESLEAKIINLNEQIDFYKNKQFSLASGIESDFTEFMNARHFFRNDFIQELIKYLFSYWVKNDSRVLYWGYRIMNRLL